MTYQTRLGSLSAMSNVRRWALRERPIWPFSSRGILPLAGFVLVAGYAVGPFARDAIQSTVGTNTRAALDEAHFTWATVEVSGQDVTLRGEPPSAAEADAALAVARRVRCATWAGWFACAVSVTGQFE